MTVIHSRTGKKVRLSSSHKLFANERETVDEAFPGDIIGLVGHSDFGIGDTLTSDASIVYREIPRLHARGKFFIYLQQSEHRQIQTIPARASINLLQEGVIQILHLKDSMTKVPLLAAVGPLQFEVVQYRLESEYGAASRLEAAPWTVVRWQFPVRR